MSQHRRLRRRLRGRGRCTTVTPWPASRRRATASALLAALLLSGCAAGMGQPAPTAEVAADPSDQLRKRATTALETRRATQAKQLFETILASAPADPEALTGLGEAEVLLGDYDAAIDHSLEAADLAGERSDLEARALHNAGLSLLLTNRTQEAETKLEQAAAVDPTSWRTWNALGRARDARRAWDEAGVAYEKALALAPDEAAVLNNLGLSKLSSGDHDAAVALFFRALEASPDLATAETNLRLALALDGRYDEAVAGVEDEALPAALNNAGYAALLRGDHPQARILFVRAIDASPSFYEPAWSNLRFLSSVEERQSSTGDAP
jgi:Flp pilus assembly protein TadD